MTPGTGEVFFFILVFAMGLFLTGLGLVLLVRALARPLKKGRR